MQGKWEAEQAKQAKQAKAELQITGMSWESKRYQNPSRMVHQSGVSTDSITPNGFVQNW